MVETFPIVSGGDSFNERFRAIAPSFFGNRYGSSANGKAYNQAATTTLFARSAFTVGILYRATLEFPQKQLDSSVNTNNDGWLFRLNEGTGPGADRLSLRQSWSNASRFATEASLGYDANTASGESDFTNELGNSQMEGVMLDVLIIDDDAYPASGWYRNGRREQADGPKNNWVNTGNADGEFELGLGSWHHICGLFYHLDAMSFEEVTALMMNAKLTRDIPDKDYTGFGTVPDHIWSVKRAMEVGTNGLASWTSDGAVGGEVLTRQDATLQVIEFADQFASAR